MHIVTSYIGLNLKEALEYLLNYPALSKQNTMTDCMCFAAMYLEHDFMQLLFTIY